MNKAALIHAPAFLSCCLAGYWITARPGAAHLRQTASSSATSAPDKPKDAITARPGADAAPSPPDSELSKTIAVLRELERVPVKEFPALFEEELRTAGDDLRVSKLLNTWMDRDLDGYIAWLKTQPGSRKLVAAKGGEGPQGVATYWRVIEKLGAKDPERAWKLIGELPEGNDDHRWQTVRAILNADPRRAAEFVRNHREVLTLLQNPNMGFYALDPVKSLPVLQELPPGDLRNTAARELSRHYTENPNNISGAGPWFQSLPPDAREAVAQSIQWRPIFGVPLEYTNRLRELWKVNGSK